MKVGATFVALCVVSADDFFPAGQRGDVALKRGRVGGLGVFVDFAVAQRAESDTHNISEQNVEMIFHPRLLSNKLSQSSSKSRGQAICKVFHSKVHVIR
jgi:hypothetical protein